MSYQEMIADIEEAENAAWAAFRRHMDTLAEMKESMKAKAKLANGHNQDQQAPMVTKQTEKRNADQSSLTAEPAKESNRKPVEKIKWFRKDLGDGLPHPLEVIRNLKAENLPKKKETSNDKEPELDASDFCRKVPRGKKRKSFPGDPCDLCSGFFTASNLESKDVRDLCKHKQPPLKRPPTPPGFYDPGWHSPKK